MKEDVSFLVIESCERKILTITAVSGMTIDEGIQSGIVEQDIVDTVSKEVKVHTFWSVSPHSPTKLDFLSFFFLPADPVPSCHARHALHARSRSAPAHHKKRFSSEYAF